MSILDLQSLHGSFLKVLFTDLYSHNRNEVSELYSYPHVACDYSHTLNHKSTQTHVAFRNHYTVYQQYAVNDSNLDFALPEDSGSI